MAPFLYLNRHVRTRWNVRASEDERRKCDWHLYSYRDESGREYRRSFEVPVGVPFTPPERGAVVSKHL